MELFFYILLFVLGLAVGSFFNVLVLRYNKEESVLNLKKISGRSHCPHCLTALKAKELIPLFSFFWQGKKCVYCRAKISWFYPVVEFFTGVIFMLAPLFFNWFYKVKNAYFFMGVQPLWYYFFIFMWLLVILTLWLIILFDWKYYLIPNGLNLFLFVLGAIITLFTFYYSNYLPPFKTSFLGSYALVFSFSDSILFNHVAGAFIGGLFFLFLVLISKGKGIGMGDVKLAFSLGMVLGWPDVGFSAILAFIFGGIIGAIAVILKVKKLQDKIPFAPIFVVGVVTTMLFGKSLLDIYFSLF